MELTEFVTKAMYVPFRTNGRNYKGWDCWGLFLMAYRDIYKVELPAYKRDYGTAVDKEKTKELIREGIAKDWQLTDQPL